MHFKDRVEAGRHLAEALSAYANRHDVVVLALPRGGVPVGFEVASTLGAPFDVFLVRKLGVPGHPEFAMGAIASGGIRVLSEDVIEQLGIPRTAVEQIAVRERLELERRDRLYRGDRQLPLLRDRTVILVDDGLATGATMEAAIEAVRVHKPARVVVAAPVCAQDSAARLDRLADEVVCAQSPEPFQAVGLWYETFDQTTDEEVIATLAKAAAFGRAHDGSGERAPAVRRESGSLAAHEFVRERAQPLGGHVRDYDALLQDGSTTTVEFRSPMHATDVDGMPIK